MTYRDPRKCYSCGRTDWIDAVDRFGRQYKGCAHCSVAVDPMKIETLGEVRADRDRLAAEVERLRTDVAYQHDINIRDEESCAAALDAAHQDQLAAEHERDAAIAARDSAVAERDELRAIVDPVRGRELIAGLQQARDSAVNDTAEAIAANLTARATELRKRADECFDSSDRREIRAEAFGWEQAARRVALGAWRGQNGGE